MLLLISAILAIVPLLGIVWVVFFGSITTVDGLFTSLILLTISGLFGANVLVELRKWRTGAAIGASPRARADVSPTGAELLQRGKVEKVEFYEANVGQTNKSVVTLSDGAASPQLLIFEGDLRNALPAGYKVEITFRKANGYNVLTNVVSA